jgi:hypothetical protein
LQKRVLLPLVKLPASLSRGGLSEDTTKLHSSFDIPVKATSLSWPRGRAREPLFRGPVRWQAQGIYSNIRIFEYGKPLFTGGRYQRGFGAMFNYPTCRHKQRKLEHEAKRTEAEAEIYFSVVRALGPGPILSFITTCTKNNLPTLSPSSPFLLRLSLLASSLLRSLQMDGKRGNVRVKRQKKRTIGITDMEKMGGEWQK